MDGNVTKTRFKEISKMKISRILFSWFKVDFSPFNINQKFCDISF